MPLKVVCTCKQEMIFYSVRESAEIAGVRRQTIYRWIDDGLIPRESVHEVSDTGKRRIQLIEREGLLEGIRNVNVSKRPYSGRGKQSGQSEG